MVASSDAARLASLLRIAAGVIDAPLAALFRFVGDRAELAGRIVKSEPRSELTPLFLPRTRLEPMERRTWYAALRSPPPAELAAFPNSVRAVWSVSFPLFAGSPREPVGLVVLADVHGRAPSEDALSVLGDVCALFEERLAPVASSYSKRSDRFGPRDSPSGATCLDQLERAGSARRRDGSSSERRIPIDAVTGLPDRTTLLDETVRRIERADVLGLGVALVIVALDRFRRVNETLGQSVGDMLLRQVGERLRESVGDADLVGRRAGDEFVVLVEDEGSGPSIFALLDRLQQALREPFHLPGHLSDRELSITASLGVARFPADARDAQGLFRCADIALSRAKQAGRGKLVVFDQAMAEDVAARAETERELRVAMRDGQFLLHYQPKFRVKDRALVGAEALLRWNHPTRGMVSPARFIPVAEDSGLIVPLGTWALGEVCRQRARWRQDGVDVGRVSVNVSALQFARPDFVGTVTRAMRAAGVEQGELELELTESIVMTDVDHVAARLLELRKHGVAVSVDDFGTGYSSLAYLQRLPVDVLKIDRSFVRPLDGEPDAARSAHALAGAIATLARGLGLEVLAEGVETEAQLAALETLGCDTLQGFLLGKPGPADELERFAAAGRGRPS